MLLVPVSIVPTSRKGVCLSRRTFFSLNSNYIEDLYTNITAIVSQTGWSYKDLFNLPIKKRNWIFQLIFKLDQQANEDGEEHNREKH